MGLKIVTTKVVGNPGDLGWSQVHDFEPDDPEKLSQRGRLFAVISSTGLGISDPVSSGREILARLHEEYFGKLEKDAFYALKEAVDKIGHEFEATFENIEIGATAVVENTVYSAVFGGAQAAILRNGMFAKILESNKDETISASGYPQESDIFILGTSAFYTTFADGVIKASLENKTVAEVGESFALAIYSKKETSDAAAVIIAFEKEGLNLPIIQKDEGGGKFSLEITQKLDDKKKEITDKITGLINRLLPQKNIYVKSDEKEPPTPTATKKTTLSAGVILLLLLFLSIGFGIRQKVDKEKKAAYNDKLNIAIHNVDEAKNLVELNPQRARELLMDAKKTADELTGQKVEDKKLTDLVNDISGVEEKILGEYRADGELFLDVGLLSSGFEISGFSASDDWFIVYDSRGKKIAKVSFGTKKAEIIAGPEEIKDKLKGAAIYSGRVFYLVGEEFFESDTKPKKVAEKEGLGDVLISAYASNLYVIDKSNGKIYRFSSSASGFGEAKDWLSLDGEYDFGKVSGWAIDGNIWISTQSGRIIKFTQGVQQDFTPSGVYPQLGEIAGIFTSEDLSGIYLLDASRGRIVVIDKNGLYLAQYLNDGLKSATGLVVSESDKKIIFSAPSGKLYFISIKHL